MKRKHAQTFEEFEQQRKEERKTKKKKPLPRTDEDKITNLKRMKHGKLKLYNNERESIPIGFPRHPDLARSYSNFCY